MPAGPVTDTRRARSLAGGGVEQVLQQAQLILPTDEGRLERLARGLRRRPPPRSVAHAMLRTGAALPLSTVLAGRLECDGRGGRSLCGLTHQHAARLRPPTAAARPC